MTFNLSGRGAGEDWVMGFDGGGMGRRTKSKINLQISAFQRLASLQKVITEGGVTVVIWSGQVVKGKNVWQAAR